MSYAFTGLAFVALSLVVVIWRTFQDAGDIADRPDRAPVPVDSRTSGVFDGDFSGISGGVGGVSAEVADGGGAASACGANGGGAPC